MFVCLVVWLVGMWVGGWIGWSEPTEVVLVDFFRASEVARYQRTENKCQLKAGLHFYREQGREIRNFWISGQLTLGLGEMTNTGVGLVTDRDDKNRTGPMGSDTNLN